MFRRIVGLALILALLPVFIPAPARAVTTAQEVQEGEAIDQQITASSVIENDPLLNQWVQTVADRLWHQVARKDVPYNVKIIRATDINAFSTLGGYVYVNDGLLDFVHSDDELAGVLGHETGHIERRHVVTMQAKSEVLNLLFGIASLFSPLIYDFGNLAEAGILAKMSRVDELQADQYGLLLMSRAGYDPNAMVTMMKHLGVLQGEHSGLITKYLQNHPDPQARVGHLLGYPELDPTKVTPQERLVWALHDLRNARYNTAMLELRQFVKTQPNNEQALLGLGQAQLALGQTGKSAQTLGEVAQTGTPQAQAAAQVELAELRRMEVQSVNLTQPNLAGLRAKLDQARQLQKEAVAEIGARHDEGRDQIKEIKARLEDISYEIPDFSNIQIKPGSRLESIEKNLTSMSRSINSALDDAKATIGGVGSVDPKTGKPTGLLADNGEILDEMSAPFQLTPIPSDSVAIFPSYSRMFAEISSADGEMVQAADAARAAAMQLDQSLGTVNDFLMQLQNVRLDYFGDIGQFDYNALVPLMQKADDSLARAAVSASQADQLYNMARARQLEARITLLGVGTSRERYATLQKALAVRFASDGIGSGVSYNEMLRDDLTPGQAAAATIVAADTKTTPDEIVKDALASNRSIVEIANDRKMNAEALEIFLGLVYLDYTDNPVKEDSPAG